MSFALIHAFFKETVIAGDSFRALRMACVKKTMTMNDIKEKSNIWRDATSCTVSTVVTMQKKIVYAFSFSQKCHSLCCIKVFHNAKAFMKGMNHVLRVYVSCGKIAIKV